MNQNEFDVFAEALGVLAEVLGDAVSPARIILYFRALEDLTLNSILNAINIAARTLRYFPKPVELRELVEGSAEDKANNAWQLLNAAYRKAGIWTSVWFEDSRLARAIHRIWGSWINLAQEFYELSDEMLAARRKEFLASYRSILSARDLPSLERYFAGYCEVENRATIVSWERGQAVKFQPVVVVCDEVFQLSFPVDPMTGALEPWTLEALHAPDGVRELVKVKQKHFESLNG